MATTVPVSGLTMIGQQLLQGSANYADRRDEQRRREERLADIQSTRSYEEGQFDKLRGLQLGDEQRRRFEALSDAEQKAVLANRMAMLQEAQTRGLIAANQLGNQAAEDAALAQLGEMLKKEQGRRTDQFANAEQALAAYTQELSQLEAQTQEIYSAAQNPPAVDMQALKNRAVEVAASRKKPGFFGGVDAPTREEIATVETELLEQAKNDALMNWNQAKENARVMLPAIRARQNSLTDLVNGIQRQSGLIATPKPLSAAPSASPLVAAPPSAGGGAPPPAGGNPMEGFLRQINQATPPPASVDSGVAQTTRALSMAPPELVPTLRQARTSQIADEYAKMDAPIMQADKAIADTQRQLQMVQSGIRPTQSFPLDPIAARTANLSGPAQQDPRAKGEVITRLLMRLAAKKNERNRALSARQQGETQLLSGLQLNTPTQSIPISVPSPGSLLSSPR